MSLFGHVAEVLGLELVGLEVQNFNSLLRVLLGFLGVAFGPALGRIERHHSRVVVIVTVNGASAQPVNQPQHAGLRINVVGPDVRVKR